MKRDVAIIPINEQECLVMAIDNSGGIGLKEHDHVKTPYDLVSEYSFRVAVMECMAAGGTPLSVMVQNFVHDDAWNAILDGIQRGIEELGLEELTITGSTESNFPLLQSALGVVVVGTRAASYQEKEVSLKNRRFAVIGSPLVGNEVLEYGKDVLPLSLFGELSRWDQVMLLPVGSKGIRYELLNMLGKDGDYIRNVTCSVDIEKSAGPATCVIIAYKEEVETMLQQKCGYLFHPLLLN